MREERERGRVKYGEKVGEKACVEVKSSRYCLTVYE